MRLLSVLLLLLFVSCNNAEHKNKQVKSKTVKKKIKSHKEYQQELTDWYDTTLTSGYFLKYVLDSTSTIRIVWGNENFKRWKADEQYPGWAPSYYKFEFQDYIALGHACGTGCWSLTLLPKNEKDSIISYDEDITSDVHRNLIFYKNYDENATRESFFVEHIPTRKKTEIVLDSLSTFGSWSNAIEQSSFVKNGIYIKWRTDKGNLKEKLFKIL